VPCFNHEVAPSYLRTKPEPGVEDKMAQLITRSSQLTQESIQVIFSCAIPYCSAADNTSNINMWSDIHDISMIS